MSAVPNRALTGLTVTGLLVASFGGLPQAAEISSGPAIAPPKLSMQQAAPADRVMLRKINRARQVRGIRMVRFSRGVSLTARPWARHLAAPGMSGRLAHDPGYNTDVRSACRGTRYASENVSFRFKWTGLKGPGVSRRAARKMFRGYMRSPGHRAHILQRDVTHVGLTTMLRRSRGNFIYVTNVMRFAKARRC